MEDSILNSTKKILGLNADYTAFDLDILTHINMAFGTVNQLGVGPDDSVVVEDAESLWSTIGLPANQLSLVRTYVFLRARLAFDPPATSFHLEAIKEQIKELEWRLNVFRETVKMEEEAV